MPEFNVTIPATMAICVTVEADDEEMAKEVAMNVDFRVEVYPEGDEAKAANPEIIAFETHNQVCRGNVFSGVLNEIEVDYA